MKKHNEDPYTKEQEEWLRQVEDVMGTARDLEAKGQPVTINITYAPVTNIDNRSVTITQNQAVPGRQRVALPTGGYIYDPNKPLSEAEKAEIEAAKYMY